MGPLSLLVAGPRTAPERFRERIEATTDAKEHGLAVFSTTTPAS